jgi:uncharacterized repeat protein (TIGR01451 family)
LIRTRARASGFESESYAGEVSDEAYVQGYEVSTLPYEAKNPIQDLTVNQKEGVLQASDARAAIDWTKDTMAQAVALLEGGNEVVSQAMAQETVTVDELRAPGTIQLLKEASTNLVNSGDTIDMVLRFRNVGGKPIAKVTILDNLAPRFAYVPESAACDRPARFAEHDNAEGSSVLTWELEGPLGAGEGGTIQFKVRVR